MYDDIIKKIPINESVFKKSMELGYTELQSAIIGCKISDDQVVDKTFNPRLSDIPDYKTMGDIVKSAEIINKHIKNVSRIAVVVDYDSDGISSAAVIYRFFKNVFKCDMSNIIFIINRRENGNGIGPKLLNTIMLENEREHIDLVITADHGSANGISIRKMLDLNIDVVVTDHHIVPEENNAHIATAFVNPQKDEDDTFKYISGCAVAYFLMVTIKDLYNYSDDVNEVIETLPIVAISTIGDAMQMWNVINRAIVVAGLKELNSLRDPLWQAVKYLLDINILMDEETIGFNIVPAINAASRMGEPTAAFNFYISGEYRDAIVTFERLLEINDNRKKMQKHLIRNSILQCIDVEKDSAIVIVLTQGLGLNGIVSSNIGERFNKPIVTFVKEKDGFHGSGRGINPNFNLHLAFTNINNKDDSIFIKFGGHKGAAGCTVNLDKINDFKRLFLEEAKEQLANSVTVKQHNVIGTIRDDDLSISIMNELKTLSPFGMGFEKVYFVGVFTLHKVIYIGRDSEHVNLKFLLSNGNIVDCFIFNSSDKFDHDLLVVGNKLKIVYRPVINTFRGNVEFRLELAYLTEF